MRYNHIHKTMMAELGIIEGFYGRPWSWDERRNVVSFLSTEGYRFYMYAPKADPFLRRRWAEPYPVQTVDALRRFSATCREHEVRFGIGLTPYDLHQDFSRQSQAPLAEKLATLDAIGVEDLGILFDDMRGDLPNLAASQIEIVDWIASRTAATRIVVCPSYYSDDPVLDRAFGARPEGYLEELGRNLDPAIQIFWTGEEVCSREISPAHIERVAGQLRRPPFLWDNYPVNDGQRMSQYLHIRAFTGRPGALADHIAAHGVNPACQATLSLIPALTLAASYRLGDRYAYGEAFQTAAQTVLGHKLAETLRQDVLILQDLGLDRLNHREPQLRERYEGVDHPAAREIVDWLNGIYRITDEIVQTQ